MSETNVAVIGDMLVSQDSSHGQLDIRISVHTSIWITNDGTLKLQYGTSYGKYGWRVIPCL